MESIVEKLSLVTCMVAALSIIAVAYDCDRPLHHKDVRNPFLNGDDRVVYMDLLPGLPHDPRQT